MAAVTTAVVGVGGLGLAAKGQSDARRASKRATQQQQQAGEAAIRRQEEAAALGLPFVQAGASQLPLLQQDLAPVTLEEDLADIQGSPIFEATFGAARRGAEGHLANEGLLGSGTGSQLLDQARTSSLLPLLQQRQGQRQQGIANRFQLAGLGQAAAAGQVAPAAAIGGLQAGIGATQAAGTVAAQNIRQQGTQDILSQIPGVVGSIDKLINPTPPPSQFVGGIADPNRFRNIS